MTSEDTIMQIECKCVLAWGGAPCLGFADAEDGLCDWCRENGHPARDDYVVKSAPRIYTGEDSNV